MFYILITPKVILKTLDLDSDKINGPHQILFHKTPSLAKDRVFSLLAKRSAIFCILGSLFDATILL